jgi:hypothetical protein
VGEDPAPRPSERRCGRLPGGLDEPGRPGGGRLAQLISPARRIALVGLAKNTGKTETLAAILAAHAQAGLTVGVTSIGRDGEERDVIDPRIAKPRVRLQRGSLVASTGALLRASGLAHERLAKTAVRTPLGEVLIARLEQEGAVEVAGPSAAADVRAVSEAMAGLGARQVLIDGAIDRRAASAPAVAEGLVMATGAVLGEQLEAVVAATAEAVDLARLPLFRDGGEPPVPVPRSVALGATDDEVAGLLRAHPAAHAFTFDGALSERFLEALLQARHERTGRELALVAQDPTKVFLSRRGPRWYERQGLSLRVREPIELRAITVNPVAPQSHSFGSAPLREAIAAAVGDEIPVIDVREA